ncbi:hypothetical protein KSS87_016048, partial [Heliosperma pusillum]
LKSSHDSKTTVPASISAYFERHHCLASSKRYILTVLTFRFSSSMLTRNNCSMSKRKLSTSFEFYTCSRVARLSRGGRSFPPRTRAESLLLRTVSKRASCPFTVSSRAW